MAFCLATLHSDTHRPRVIEGTIHANPEHFLLSFMDAASPSFTYTDHIFPPVYFFVLDHRTATPFPTPDQIILYTRN